MTAGVLVVAGALFGLGAAVAGATLPKGWRVAACRRSHLGRLCVRGRGCHPCAG